MFWFMSKLWINFVIIFRDVLGFIKVDQRFFSRDQFLESMDYEDRPFYEKVYISLPPS